MKGFKGLFLKKIKLIPTLNTLRKGFAFYSNPQQYTFFHQNCYSQPVYKDQDCKFDINIPDPDPDPDPDPVLDSEDQTELDTDVGPQPAPAPKEDHSRLPVSDETVPETAKIRSEEHACLEDFEERCPPGGEDCVVLYTTSLRGIRKTFQDCRSIRYLLNSFKILIHERDVSMDMEFREQLWRLFNERVVPPKLFIKGRYIGGADEVIGLHEEGKLKKLLKGIPSIHIPCRDCANMRFLVCPNCNGSRKIFAETIDHYERRLRCPNCNENGLVKCPICS
ncbi:hypothetical protein V6N13_042942 [Hibiscus sabdariffa]|uniref:Glutaredoxin domain-containing protein n=1 Tax=Hibiscus sabdariffa TaxID=183260 RepID=A0ABR2G323_9ROSI